MAALTPKHHFFLNNSFSQDERAPAPELMVSYCLVISALLLKAQRANSICRWRNRQTNSGVSSYWEILIIIYPGASIATKLSRWPSLTTMWETALNCPFVEGLSRPASFAHFIPMLSAHEASLVTELSIISSMPVVHLAFLEVKVLVGSSISDNIWALIS